MGFGIGFFELIIVVGVLVIIGAVVVVALTMAASGRGKDDRRD